MQCPNVSSSLRDSMRSCPKCGQSCSVWMLGEVKWPLRSTSICLHSLSYKVCHFPCVLCNTLICTLVGRTLAMIWTSGLIFCFSVDIEQSRNDIFQQNVISVIWVHRVSNRITFSMWRSLLWASSCCVTDHVSLIEKQTHHPKKCIQSAPCLTYSRLVSFTQTQIVFCFYLAIYVRKQTGTDGVILHKLLKRTHYFLTRVNYRFFFKQKPSCQGQTG